MLGIDVGGTKVALRLEQDDAIVEASFRWPSSGGVAADFAALAENLRFGSVASVGIAMPATVDAAGQVVSWPGRPSWVGVDLRARFAELLPGAAISWADDGDLAALAEAHALGAQDIVYLGVGTGVGGGIVLGGRCCPGTGSAEVGHMVVAMDGPVCDCSRRGCVQALASGPATLRYAAELRGAPVSFTELGSPEDWAVQAIARSARAVATAVVSLAELVRPSAAVIGGGFAHGVPGFVPLVAGQVAELARQGHPVPPVHAAILGGLSSLHGAVLLARDGVVQTFCR